MLINSNFNHSNLWIIKTLLLCLAKLNRSLCIKKNGTSNASNFATDKLNYALPPIGGFAPGKRPQKHTCGIHCMLASSDGFAFDTQAMQGSQPRTFEVGVTAPIADVLEDVYFADVDVDVKGSGQKRRTCHWLQRLEPLKPLFRWHYGRQGWIS